MTRIHKKPGSKAWKKSVKKSASRMARDWMRAPKSENWKSFLKNKNPEEHKKLLELVTKFQSRRFEKINKRKEMFEIFQKRANKIMNEINKLITKVGEGDLASTVKAKQYIDVFIPLKIELIQEMQALEKQLPIKEARKWRSERIQAEHKFVRVIRNLKKLENTIAEEEADL